MSVVSINAVMGEGGLINRAKQAAEMTANSTIAEQEEMNRLEAEFANVMAGGSEITRPKPVDPTQQTPTQIGSVTYLMKQQK